MCGFKDAKLDHQKTKITALAPHGDSIQRVGHR